MVDGLRNTSWVSISDLSITLYYLTASSLHVEIRKLNANGACNRLVQTEMGNKGAQMMGLKEAPNTIEEAVTKTMATVSTRR